MNRTGLSPVVIFTLFLININLYSQQDCNNLLLSDSLVGIQTLLQIKPLHIDSYFDETSALDVRPNPFANFTLIEFEINKHCNVKLNITDLYGRELAVLVEDGYKEPGVHEVVSDGSELSVGVYFVRLRNVESVIAQKIIQLK